MNRKIIKILAVCLLLAAVTFGAGCTPEQTPYEINDSENYTLSIKFDANGGTFTTNTSVIVDSFDVSAVPAKDGKTQIALIPPDHPARGHDAFTAINNGYFLAGWYRERTETKDAAGKTVYTYAQPWNFETDRVQMDTAGTYTSAEPVMTLYAAWVPLFQVDFVDLASGETLGSYSFDPSVQQELLVPQWDTETGAIEMYQFPERKDYTFDSVYYDAKGTQAVKTPALEHPGTVDYATGTAKDPVLTVYTDWLEGEWYHIYNVEQFLDNASLNGSYVLYDDLDFTDEIWPTMLMYGSYTGTIQGNGHTVSNVQVTQTNNSKSNAGLFGRLTETAGLTDVTFENITFTVEGGTRVAGTSYGLLAGAISPDAELSNVSVRKSMVQIDAKAYFGTDDYVIGLISGIGGERIDHYDIRCTFVGESDPQLYAVADEDGFVTLTDDPKAVQPKAMNS